MYPYILMILVVIFYAGNILTGKAINDLPPLTIAFFRLLIAFLILFPIAYRSAWKSRATFFNYKWPFLLMTLSGVTFFNTFIYGSLQFTSSTNVAVIETVIPALTVVLSAFLLKERLRKIQWGGILISFIGAIWVVMDGRIFHLTTVDWNIGDGIMIGAVISWSIYSIVVKKYMHFFPPYAAIFTMTAISVFVLFPLVMVEWSITGVPTFENNYIGGLLYLGIFPSFIALLFFNRAVDLLGASQASVFLNFLPVFTMIGGYFWLGETITIMHILGTIVVIGGVMLTTQVRRKQTNTTLPKEVSNT